MNQKIQTKQRSRLRKAKRLGIVGGLGPETSSAFLLSINRKVRSILDTQPNISLENVPISKESEIKLINGGASKEHLSLIKESITNLNNNNVDFIVIPCNTVHTFIEEFRNASRVPIISIIEETSKECVQKNIKKIALLASTKTVNEKLHEIELLKNKISLFLPNKKEQKEISKIIFRIVNSEHSEKDTKFLLKIINNLRENGAEAVILGCTDLPLLISEKNSPLPIINTLSVLEKSTIGLLCGGILK